MFAVITATVKTNTAVAINKNRTAGLSAADMEGDGFA